MPAHELVSWAAFERVWGPILVHERVDVGLAQIGYTLARLLGKSRSIRLRDFLPSWWSELVSEDSVRQGFDRLLRMAEDADDLDADR